MDFFWLHIKKCGGESFRDTFTPPYVQTDRVNNPTPFIAAPKSEWNDVLNNYRIPLGEYDYKRTLFAKKFLYTAEEFDHMFKFAIIRNPYDRAVSTWKYLLNSKLLYPKRLHMKFSFEKFLTEIPNFWKSKSDRHIATHTAPIWPDITDESGKLLLDQLLKLEHISDDITILQEKLGWDISHFSHVNKNRRTSEYHKHYNAKTRKLVEALYKDDFENLNYEF